MYIPVWMLVLVVACHWPLIIYLAHQLDKTGTRHGKAGTPSDIVD